MSDELNTKVEFDLYPFGPLPILTPDDLAADIAYRDRMMSKVTQAAMSDEESRKLIHARVREQNYAADIARLIEQGQRSTPQFHGAVEELADALYDQGKFHLARNLLESLDPQHPRIPYIARLLQAIDRPDDDHCGCPPTDKLARRVYVGTRYIDHLICANCGHENATETLPQDYKNLVTARGLAPMGSGDQVVLGHAARLGQ